MTQVNVGSSVSDKLNKTPDVRKCLCTVRRPEIFIVFLFNELRGHNRGIQGVRICKTRLTFLILSYPRNFACVRYPELALHDFSFLKYD